MKIYLICFSLLFFLFSFPGQSQVQKENKLPTKYEYTLPKPDLVRGPYLQAASNESIIVRWRTSALARSRVRFGTTMGKLDEFADDSTLVTEHKVKLTGLSPGTKYYYSIGAFSDTLQGNSDNYFMTMPVPGTAGTYRIGVFGDCGTDSLLQKNVRNSFLDYLGNDYLNAWILLGDNAYENGTDAQYQQNFFNVYKNDLLKRSPLFPGVGNHDYGNVDFRASAAPHKMDEVAYFQIFSMPVNGESGGVPSNSQAYYAFNIGNVHFVALDSYGKENNEYFLYDTLSPQVRWLKKDLEAKSNQDWVVVYFHHPPYSKGSHDSDEEETLTKIRKNLLPILERYGVDIVFSGHSHIYERSKLMKGHYGMSNDFDELKYNLSLSPGHYNGDDGAGPYIKNSQKNQGTVYVVTGSAGKLDKYSPSFVPHKAMSYSNNTHGGAVLLEVQETKLDLNWICEDGVVRDNFTIIKEGQ